MSASHRLATGLLLLALVACTPGNPVASVLTPSPGSTTVRARIALPGVDLGKLRAAVGMAAPQPVAGNGFSGTINPGAIGLLAVLIPDGTPVMLAIRPPDLPGDAPGPTDLDLSPMTTAVALAYLTPLIARDDPAEQRPTLELIAALPETGDLAARIDAALRRDLRADPLNDSAVYNALGRVIAVLLDRLARREAPARILIRPGEGSRVSVAADPDVPGMFTLVNAGRRFVDAYSGSAADLMPLASMGPLVNLGALLGRPPLAPQTGQVRSDLAATQGDVITVYGLGAAAGAPDPAEAARWGPPAARTLWTNLARPLLRPMLNVPEVSDDVLAIYARSVTAGDTVSRFVASAQSRDYGAAVQVLTEGFVNAAQANGAELARAALQPTGATDVSGAAALLALPLKIVTRTRDSVNFGAAIGDLVSARWKETFSLAPQPVPNDQAVSVPFNQEQLIDLSATNPKAIPLGFVVVAGPSHGTLRHDGASPSYFYMPATNYVGPDAFAFRLTIDGVPQAETGTITITVRPRINNAPIAQNRRATVLRNSHGRYLTLKGLDPDLDRLSYTIITPPTLGTLTGPAPGSDSVVYVPPPDYLGPDSFTYRASDGRMDSNIATFSLVVTKIQSISYIGASGDFGHYSGNFEVAITPIDTEGEFVGDQIPQEAYSFSLCSIIPGNVPVDAEVIGIGIIPPSTQGVTAVLVFDSSGSMSANDPNAVGRKAGGNAFFDEMTAGDTAAVLDFGAGRTPPLMACRLLQDFTGDTALLRSALNQLTAGGNTPLYEAVLDGLGKMQPVLGGPANVLIVLTDGMANGAVSLDEAISAARAKNIPVYPVGLGQSVDFTQLRRLADETGGVFTQASDAAALQEVFRGIVRGIKLGQVIVFGQAYYNYVPSGLFTLKGNLITDIGGPPQFLTLFTAAARIP